MRNGYYCCDAASMIAALPDISVDLTITSPPYGSMKDYGASGQIGFGQTYEEYLNSLVNVFAVLFRKTAPTGSLWVVADTFKENSQLRLLPFDLANRLNSVGWSLRDIIIWDKTKTLPWSGWGQLRRTFEYILFFAKTSSFKYYISRIKEPDNLKEWWVKYPERYSPEGKVPTSIWSFPIPVQGSWAKTRLRHFCPFPASLVERIITLTTDKGDCVLDPFAGSGVVLAQAKAMGRRYLGCDVNKSYKEQFKSVTAELVNHRWLNRKEKRVQNGTRQAALAENISKLRQTKFPKELFKRLKSALGETKVKTIKAILADGERLKNPPAPHLFSKLEIYIVCDGGTPVAAIEAAARQIACKPPLSKYGILANIYVICANNGDLQYIPTRQRRFIYEEGATHYYVDAIRRRDWLNSVPQTWKRIPPVICNIGVRQALTRTWAPRAD